MPDRLIQFEVSADLDCELDGVPIRLQSIGRHVTLGLPDLTTGLRLIRLGTRGSSLRTVVKRIKEILDSLHASLEVQVNGTPVAEIGNQVGTRWWLLLGLPKLRLKPVELIRVAARERRK